MTLRERIEESGYSLEELLSIALGFAAKAARDKASKYWCDANAFLHSPGLQVESESALEDSVHYMEMASAFDAVRHLLVIDHELEVVDHGDF